MSVRAIEAVLEHSKTAGVDRLVLLVMASDADDDGRNCFRGPASMARRANCSRDWIKKVMRRLRDAGEIVPDGVSKHGTTKYRLAVLTGVRSDPGSDPTPGPISPQPGVRSDPRGGVRSDPQLVSNSSESRQTTSSELDDARFFREVFDYWRATCNHPTAKPTRERKAKVIARRREGYTLDNVKTAINGAAAAAFVNDAGKRFDDLELICRNGSKLEDFIARASTTTATHGMQDDDYRKAVLK